MIEPERSPYILSNIDGGSLPRLELRRMTVDEASAANDHFRVADSPLRWLPAEIPQKGVIGV